MHSLDEKFLGDLADGMLVSLRRAVISDPSLCMELRGHYVNVYYRGGNLLKVSQRPKGYDISFDTEYFRRNSLQLPQSFVSGKAQLDAWMEVYPRLKQVMDVYFGQVKRKDEREFQQLLVRENNFGRVARNTDYFICDIEYQEKKGRFDAIAVHWPGRERKQTHKRRLVLVEIKYGDGSLSGDAGLHKHIKDIDNFLARPEHVRDLKADMVRVFNQKVRLDLIDCGKELGGFSEEPPVVLLVLANHNPRSSILRKVLNTRPECPHARLCIATASFVGYGLYDQGIYAVEEAVQVLEAYIHSRSART